MSYKTTYWDGRQQRERDCTADEIAEIDERKTPKAPTAAEKQSADAAAAKADAKVAALGEMTPAQVRAWVQANVSSLADAKDVLATLAVAVSVLARRI